MIRKYAEIFCWKNVSSFCSAKATHIFSAKNIRLLYIESAKTVNEMTLNELVKLTTLWTTWPWSVALINHQWLYLPTCHQWLYLPTCHQWLYLPSCRTHFHGPKDVWHLTTDQSCQHASMMLHLFYFSSCIDSVKANNEEKKWLLLASINTIFEIHITKTCLFK